MDIRSLIERLQSAAKEEIRISYIPHAEELQNLCSKIGGKPWVPSNFVWPFYEGTNYDGQTANRPLSFLAQINLEDVAALDTESLLPKNGMLSFFYELETMTWGFNPKDKGSAKVFYFPDDALVPADFPGVQEIVVPECSISFKKRISLPDYSEFLDKDNCEWDDYDALRTECGYEPDEYGNYIKLLGYADIIQSSMKVECEAVSRGYYMGSKIYKSLSAKEKTDIERKAEDWILLFQMGTVCTNEKEFMFGDCGHIYFWIRKDDLKSCNFENIWLILQCG